MTDESPFRNDKNVENLANMCISVQDISTIFREPKFALLYHKR